MVKPESLGAEMFLSGLGQVKGPTTQKITQILHVLGEKPSRLACVTVPERFGLGRWEVDAGGR